MKALGVALATVATGVLLAACGGAGGLIPATNAGALITDLNNISAAVSNFDCPTTETAIRQADSDFARLPPNVNPTLRMEIQNGLSTLVTSARKQCVAATGPTGPTSTTGPTGTSGQSGPSGPSGSSGASGPTSSTSSTSSTSTSSTASTTTSSTASTTTDTTTGATGPTCTTTPVEGGGTPACDGATGGTPSTGIGGPGTGGAGD
jgi:hypothetical protein